MAEPVSNAGSVVSGLVPGIAAGRRSVHRAGPAGRRLGAAMAVAALAAFTGACASEDPPPFAGWDGGAGVDFPPDCAEGPPLLLGVCVDDATGGACAGTGDEAAVFSPMPSDGRVPMVIGPQGATMFVLSARTRDIDPGDPAAPFGPGSPQLEIVLADADGADLALYRGRAAFEADPLEVDSYVQAGIFVVADVAPVRLSGARIEARGILTDRLGNLRCGTAEFTAGELRGR